MFQVRIEKENMVIRSAEERDAEKLNAWWNDGAVMEHAGFPNGLGESMEDTLAKIRRKQLSPFNQLCIIEIDGQAVGELSYTVKEAVAYPGWNICESDFQNQGYGSKLIVMLIDFLFTDERINQEQRIERIEWDTLLENKRAQHVYEDKIGARKVTVQVNVWQDQVGNWRSAVLYEITREVFYKLFSKT